MSADEPTGVDLARVALAAAKEAAKKRGTSTSAKRTPKRRPAARRDGRDPLGLGEALARLITERGWETPAAGGSVMDQWQTIATPEIAAHLRPVAFDEATGRLDLVPDTNAWATQARLISAQLIRKANGAVGTEAVRQIRVLPVGSRTPAPAELAPQPPAPAPRGDIHTRETASAGHRRARAGITTTVATPPPVPVRSPEDRRDEYHQIRAAMESRNPTPPPATPAQPRTRDDRCDGYRRTVAQIGAPVPARPPTEAPVRTRETASAGYQAALRAHLEAKGRTRTRPA